MLGFHPQHHVGFQVDAGQQQRPDELVLAAVVEVQAHLVVAEGVGQDLGPGDVAVRHGPELSAFLGHRAAAARHFGTAEQVARLWGSPHWIARAQAARDRLG